MIPSSLGGTSLTTRYIFGLKEDVRNNIQFIDEHKLIYPAGHNVIEYNLEDKSQKFYSGGDMTLGITAIAVSPSKTFLAIAEKSENGASVSIYDLKSQRKKKALSASELLTQEFKCVAFSPSGASERPPYIITLGGAPDNMLLSWKWDKQTYFDEKVIPQGSTNELYQCSYCPVDASIIIVTGNDVFKYYKVEGKEFTAVHTQVNQLPPCSTNFLAHSWTIDGQRLLLTTDAGEIVMLNQDGQLNSILDCSPMNGSIECIQTFSNGFLTGGENAVLGVYADIGEEDDHLFQLKKLYRDDELIELMGPAKITSITIVPNSEDFVVYTFDNKQIRTANIGVAADVPPNFNYLICNFHSGSITGLDVCVRKPFIVTCSQDKTVRIWNYQERRQEIFEKFHQESEAVACAIHPSGFHIIVGFQDKIKLMNVFTNKLKPYHNIPLKQFREVVFSNGGHMFAAAHNQQINVYNFYTCETPTNYKAHSNKIKSICWYEDDSGFISSDMGGSIYEWSIKDVTPGPQYYSKGTNFTCVLKIPNEPFFYAVGSDKLIKEIKKGQDNRTKISAGTQIGQIALTNSQKIFFAGRAEAEKPGSVRCYKYPLSGDYTEIQAHSKEIERLKVTHDDSYLFTTGADGCLIFYEIKDKEKGIRKEREDILLPVSEEILTNKQELDDLTSTISTLKGSNQELENPDGVLHELDFTKQDTKIGTLLDDLTQLSASNKTRYDTLTEEIRKEEQKGEEDIKQSIDGNQNEMEKEKTKNTQKLSDEATKFNELAVQKEEQYRKYKEDREKLLSDHNFDIQEKEQEFKIELQQNQKRINDDKDAIERKIQTHEEIAKQIADDTSKEIETIRVKNKEDTAKITDIGFKAKGDLQVTIKKLNENHQKVDDLKRERRDKEENLKKQEEDHKALLREKKQLEEEMKSKDRDIGEMERNIYELKKKTQELEKFKFVLDYKIKELKRDINPREEEIQKLKKQTNKMDKKLKQFNRVNAHLGLMVKDLQEKQAKMQSGITNERNKLRENANKIKRMKDDVYETVQFIDNHEKLRECVAMLLKKYSIDENRSAQIDTDIQKEYTNQREYLQDSVKVLKQRLAKDSEIHRQDNLRARNENRQLILDINKLEEEKAYLLSKLKGKSAQKGGSQMTYRGEDDIGKRSERRITEFSFRERAKEIDENKSEIDRLRRRIEYLADENTRIRTIKQMPV